MVAIVTGNGLGLQSSSLGLGSKGQIGNAAFGQGGEQLYVNAANGNLVIRDRDELLLGQGIASELYRAYNSQGQLQGDAWRPGVSRTVDGLTGTLNTAGSTITRTDWDGSTVVYAYDTASQVYVATTGQGARDTLSYHATNKTWTWTQGSTRVTETYDATHNGRITTTVDTSGNTIHYAYNAQGLLSSVTTASGEVTYLDYQGTQLTQLRTVLKNPDGSTRTQTAVRYSYDSLGRMSQVTVDLSPDDNSIADGKVYTTTYTYDGGSSRIASITASDGAKVAFTYQRVNGDYRVASIAETADTGVVRVTTLTYANGQTTITDPLGQRTVLSYDSNGRLTRLDSPAVDGVVNSQRFTYDAQGNITSLTNALGNVVTFTYDARGNLLTQEQRLADSSLLRVEYTYDAANRRLSETTYRTPGTSGTKGGIPYINPPSDPLTAHYVYDNRGLLRFALTPEGRVTEYRYNAAGQQVSAISYSGSTYAGSTYGETELASWVNALSDKRQAVRTDTAYDFRGNVASITQYSQLLVNGEGDAGAALTQTLYVYDPFGRLVQRYIGTPGAAQMQHFSYDGLGRLLTATQFDGTLTTYLYDDASHQVSATYSNGLVRTTLYNLAGEAISLVESAQGKVLSQTFNSYDALGRLTKQIDANGGRTHYLYDAASRLIGEVGPEGSLTEYRYDANGQLGETIRYATPLSAAALASLDASLPADGVSAIYPSISLSANHALDAIRPSASANDRTDWRIYDRIGRLIRSIDAAGVVTEYDYDGANRLLSITVYATPADLAKLVTEANTGKLSERSGRPDAVEGRTAHYVYDKDNRLVGELNAEGYLTEYRYDSAGQLIETIRYAAATPEALREKGNLADLRPAASAQDRHTGYHYDSRGLLTTEVDGEGWLTTYTYDAYGNVASRTRGQRVDPAQWNAPQQVSVRFEAQGPIGKTVEVWVDGVKVGVVTLTASTWTAYTLDVANVVPLIHHTIELKGTSGAAIGVRHATFGARAIGSDITLSDDTAAHYTLDALQTMLAWATLPGQLEQTQYAYDADGRLLSVTQVGLDGVVGSTAYTYDSQGRVTSETRDGRSLTYRYDLQGRLIGQLGGEGSAALAALGSNASQAQIDAVWATYGVRYGYDAGGRRTSMTDATGATTLYYYNDANQLSAVINALGEVVAYSSDVFGNLTQTTVYASRVATGTLGTLVGGMLTDTVRQLLGDLSSSEDRITRYNYTARGELATRTDALGYTTDYTYNTFGEATRITQQLDKQGQATTTTYAYDRLGQQTSQTTDAAGLNLITQAIYDAFGRVIESVDANGIHRIQQYDKAGQLIVVTDGLGQKTQLSYDAFGNVLSKTDANGHTITYTYSTFNRQVTMTTAEGITVTTQYDSFGQVIALTDGNGHTTRYQYNQDGQLTQTTDALNNSTKQTYNAAGQLIDTTDARGTKITYSYDAAGRVLTRTIDPSGLNLTTTYAYNAMSEVIRVTDPAGTVTDTRYDANGQSVAVIVDPDGLALTTTFAYDGAGNTVQVTEGAGTTAQKVTQYTYDNAGRLISTVVDPGGLNLTTSYMYDGNGNAVAVINANGHVTRYLYDANNQLTLTVDATGAVTRNVYDAAGNIIARTQYANRIDLSGLGNTLSEADVSARLTTSANDRLTRFAYDNDNRLRFTIDALGYVTEQRYDANGNVVRSIAYSRSVNVGGMPTTAQWAATLAAPSYSNLPDNRYVDYVYDASNRLRYTVDTDFQVREYTYDANGNQIARTGYFFSFVTGANSPFQTMGDLQAWTASHKSLASDRTSLFFYDSANRLVYERDPASYVTSYIYDAAGHITARIRYDNAFSTIAATDTVASMAAKLVNQSGTTTQQRYDSAGRLTDVIDALGGITHHTLDAMGRVISTTVAYGADQAVTTTRVFDAAGRAIEETRAAGTAIATTTRYVYDALGQLIQVVDPRGVALVTGPDSQALRDQRKALGVVDSAGNGKGLDQLSDADIAKLLSYYTATTVYDAVGNAIQTQSPYGAPNFAGPQYAVVNTAYDAFGNAVKVTDARGYSGYFYYDGNNRVTAQVDPNGYLTTTDYNAFGEPITISQYVNRVVGAFDEHSRPVVSSTAIPGPYVPFASANDVLVTKMTYDQAGRLGRITDATGAFESYVYTGFGDLMSFTNKLGAYTTYAHDRLGRLTSQTTQVDSHRNIILAYAYDARGNRMRESCSEGGVILSDTYYTYDALDRLVTTKHPGIMVVSPGQATAQRADIVETQRYDVRGNVIERIDANGNRTVYYYDAANRLIGEVSATGAYTQYDYDAAGNRTRSLTWSNFVGLPANAAVLPAGHGAVREVQYTYDAANRLIQTFQPNVLTAAAGTAASNNTDYATSNGITRSWVYDANGQLVLQTDGNGHTSRTWYDAVGNAILSIDAEGYGVAWTRDANGNVLNETRFAQRHSGDPAALGDPNTVIVNWSRSGDDRVTDYTYDKNGRMLSETRHGVMYGTVDAYGRLTQQSGDAATIYAYDKAGNLIKRIDANGAVYTFEYDYEGRLTATVSPSFTDDTGAMVQTRTEYVFDALGRVVKETLKGSGAPDQVSTYVYDALGRLVSKTNALGQTATMDYDAAGNLVQMRYTRTDSAGVKHNDLIAIQYDAANREVWRQTYEDGSTQGSPARRTQYNLYGDVTARGTGDTAWQEVSDYDNAGRLIRSNAGDGITRIYLYDAEGNATMQFESQSLDLRTLAMLDANGNVNLDALYDPNVYPWLSWTLTTYDGRNQVTDVIQPSMALDGQYLGLTPRPVAGGAPGQIGVEVGGPVGGAPQWPSISPSDALKTTPGANAYGPIDFTFTGYRYQQGQQYNYSDNWVGYNVFLPDLTALYGDYEILLTGTDRFGRPSFEGTNQYPPYTGHGDSSNGNYASITVHDVWAGRENSLTLTVRIAVDIRLRSTGEVVHLSDYVIDQVHRYQGNRDLTQNNGYGGEVKASGLPQSSQLKLSPTDSSQLVGGAINAHIYVRAGGNGQYTELPIRVGNPSTVDLSSLNPGWVYDVIYIAERPDGSLARSEHYTLTAGDNPTISAADQNPEAAFNTFGGGTFIIADNALIGVNLTTTSGQRAAWASFAYRRPGSNDEWTWTPRVEVTGFNGSKMYFDGIPDDGPWEINLWMFDSNNNALQMLAGTLVTGGAPSISLDYPHPAGNAITFTNIPLGADRVHLVLTNGIDGTPWDFGEFPITTPGTFAFDMPDWMMNQVAAWGGAVTFTVDATFTDDYIVPTAVYTANGTLQAGTGRNPTSAINVQGNVYELNFNPLDDNGNPFDDGQYLLLRYWPEDADIITHPELIQTVLILRSPDGRYHWDSIGLDPNQSYAYYYDVYRTQEEAQNPGDEVELTRNEGYFTPSHGTTTEWQWVIGDVHHDAVTIHRHQGYNAFGEVSSETDGRGNTVELYYNTLGNLTLKRDPLVAITYANGYQASIRPETTYSYDRTGRLVGQIDPNGHLTTQIWNDGTGTVAQEFRADGGTTVYHYDVFGNQRVKIDALDVYSVNAASARRTDYTYDAGGNLIRIERPAVNGQRAVDTYTYDEFGRRLSHTNSVTGTDTVDYDLEGNVSQIVSAAGRVTTYTHAWDGSLYGGAGGWVQTTRLPYNAGDNAYGQSVLIDVSTAFGQTTQHVDIAGRVTEYLYYNNGLLKQQGATQYTYYNNGLLHSMVDTENGTRGYYEYDNNGNLTFEGFTGKSGNWAFQQSVAKYDALNRLVEVKDPRYNILYEYDAVGNRIHMRSEYNDAFGQPNQVQDYWYAYDAMNRFTTTMGQLKDGRRGDSATDTSAYVWEGSGGDGVRIEYNAFGERMLAAYASDGHTERYEYDGQGYLTTTTLTNASGTTFTKTIRTNDLAGRVLEYVEWDLIANRVTQDVQHTWDNDSLLLRDRVVAWDASATDDNGHSAPRYTITVTTTNRLGDGTVSSTYTDYDSKNDGSSPHTTITTTYEYVWFDRAQQSTIKVQASNQDAPGWAPGLSAFEYDSFGRIKAAYDVEGGRGFAYQTDGEGRILQRDELLGTYDEQVGKIINATSNRWHAYYYLDDQQIGNVGNDGVERIDYAQELAQRAQNNSNKDSQHKRFQPVAGADFDGNYLPINSLYPTAAPGSYIVHAGDTLTSIAMALWGDSALWWLLADANGLSLNEPLIPNTVLTVPNKVTNIHNNASTFRPYDAGKALGDTNPTIPNAPPPPPPPGKKGCGGLLQVVAIAVAVVATIYTAGAAAGLLLTSTGAAAGASTFGVGLSVLGGSAGIGAAIGVGAVAGAVGSIASQGALIAGGAQKDFNWKGVAMSAVGTAATAGVASSGWMQGINASSNSFVSGAIQGATSTAAANVIGSVTGMQSFNWKNVAAGAVSQGVSRGVSQNLPGTTAGPGSTPTFGNQLAGSTTAGVASAAVYGNLSQQAVLGTTMNALGATIGNSVAGQMAAQSQTKAKTSGGNGWTDKDQALAEQIIKTSPKVAGVGGAAAIPAYFDVTTQAFKNDPSAGAGDQMEYDAQWMRYAQDQKARGHVTDMATYNEAQQKYNAAAMPGKGMNNNSFDPNAVALADGAINQMIDANGWQPSPSTESIRTLDTTYVTASTLSNVTTWSGSMMRASDYVMVASQATQPVTSRASSQIGAPPLSLMNIPNSGEGILGLSALGGTADLVRGIGEAGMQLRVGYGKQAFKDWHNGAFYTNRGNPTPIASPELKIEFSPRVGKGIDLVNLDFTKSLKSAMPVLEVAGTVVAWGAVGVEALAATNWRDPLDIGHLTVSAGSIWATAAVGSAFGGPVGAAAGITWGVIDYTVSKFQYQGQDGWRALYHYGSDKASEFYYYNHFGTPPR